MMDIIGETAMVDVTMATDDVMMATDDVMMAMDDVMTAMDDVVVVDLTDVMTVAASAMMTGGAMIEVVRLRVYIHHILVQFV